MASLKIPSARTLKLAIIGLPVLLSAAYFLLFASDRFVSESTVALQRAGNDAAAAVPGAVMMLAGLAPPSREETLYVRQYVHSLALLQRLDARLGLRTHWASPKLDVVFRLGSNASQEDFLEYYRRRVDVSMDELSSTLTVRTQGFDPAFSKRLNDEILRESERFVNDMSHKLAREQLGFAESELARTGQLLETARAEVLAFQSKNRLLDPTVQAQASGALVAQMQSQLTQYQTELQSLRSFLNEDAYQIRALKTQIAATEQQMNAERARATGTDAQSARLGTLAVEFRALQTKAEYALDAYKLALAAVEAARIDTTRKIKSLVVIEPPTTPQTAEYPRRLYNLASLLVACLLLYGVARLVIATIREHQD